MKRAARLLLGVAVAYVVIASALPPERVEPWRVLVAGLLAAGLWVARRAAGKGARPEHRLDAPVGAPDEPPADQVVRLARLEAALRLAAESCRQFDRSVRPLLVGLAEDRLVARHGVVPAERPEVARQLMGEEIWRLYEAERAGLVREGPGPDPAGLRRLVERIAAL